MRREGPGLLGVTNSTIRDRKGRDMTMQEEVSSFLLKPEAKTSRFVVVSVISDPPTQQSYQDHPRTTEPMAMVDRMPYLPGQHQFRTIGVIKGLRLHVAQVA